jgi:hypothetical protein
VIRVDGFGRSAAFAAAAALGWIPWAVLVGPIVGLPAARAVWLVGATALYAGGLATSAPRRASATVVVAAAGAVAALVARGVPELCLALAVLLGAARSGILRPHDGARAVALEAALVVGGLVFARFLAGSGTAAALWGFFLVQSCFFLAGGAAPRRAEDRPGDPFDEACARAAEVLQRPLG